MKQFLLTLLDNFICLLIVRAYKLLGVEDDFIVTDVEREAASDST
jgi:hypothetical protein